MTTDTEDIAAEIEKAFTSSDDVEEIELSSGSGGNKGSNNRSSNSQGKSKFPRWLVRAVISFVVSVLLLFLLKPKIVTVCEYDSKSNECKTHVKFSKFLFASVVSTAVLYFVVVKKWY